MADHAATPFWRSRITRTGDADPAELLNNPHNWRLHPLAQQEALHALLDDIGWVSSIIVNETTGHIIDGHLRVREALAAGAETIPVTYVSLTATEEAQVLALLDPLRALADLDPQREAELLAQVQTDSAALQNVLALIENGLPPDDGAETGTKGDLKPPEKKPKLEFKIVVGPYSFIVGLTDYTLWINDLYETVGGDEGAVVDELYRRLGLDAVAATLEDTPADDDLTIGAVGDDSTGKTATTEAADTAIVTADEPTTEETNPTPISSDDSITEAVAV